MKHVKKKSSPTKLKFHFGKFNWWKFVPFDKWMWFVLEKYFFKRCTNSTKFSNQRHSDRLFFSNICQLMEYQCSYFPGLDREYSCTHRGGSTCGHQSSEERHSILLTVILTIVLAMLYWCVRFIRQVTITLEGRNCQLTY